MNPKEILQARLAELRKQVDDLFTQRGTIIDAAAAEKRGMTEDEQKSYDGIGTKREAVLAEIGTVEARLAEVDEQEKREAAAAQARVTFGTTSVGTGNARVTDPVVYARGNVQASFFRDVYLSRKGDRDAHDRLLRHQAQVQESRALSTATGAGGEFAPPLWLISDYAKLARAGRKFADSLHPMTLPSGVSSINIPRVTAGTSTAVQASQNSSLSDTDLTTDSISSGISTIAGKQVVSLQLIEQSGMPFDEVVAGDLAADHARSLDKQSISGSGSSGQLEGVYTYFTASGTVNVTYTSSTPAVASATAADSFYSKIFAAASSIETNRFLPADTIWMHPRRWNWVLAASDTTNRPLVVPFGTAFNAVGDGSPDVAEGVVGQIGGLQVITDANLPTNTGAGTNQDPVLVGVRSDLKLWESALHADSFDAPYADSMGILFRIYSYAAQIPSRYTTSVSVINGTGLVAPSF